MAFERDYKIVLEQLVRTVSIPSETRPFLRQLQNAYSGMLARWASSSSSPLRFFCSQECDMVIDRERVA
jgi:hypothetical protein